MNKKPTSFPEECELIVGNSNSNFSGVTSTMLQVLPHLQTLMNVRVMGKHHLPDPSVCINFWQVAKMCRQPLSNRKWRVFHARRVNEMIQALALKFIFRAKIKIVFSSAAQRHRAGFTLWLTRQMDAVLAMCKSSAKYLADAPDAIIPHGTRTDVYKPPENKSEAWQAMNFSGKYGIAILGRVRKQKGVHLFVNACIELLDKHPDYTAVIVGQISSSNEAFVNELREKVEAAGLSDRIIFTGEQRFERIPTFFQSLSIVAALSDNEGFGLTVLEAMSSGAAVLATQAGAWEEIIREGTDGYVVPVNNQAAVTKKMDTLLSKPELLAQMGRNGRERILEHYTVEREAKELCEFFRTL